jgi:CRISPR-associated protein Cas1
MDKNYHLFKNGQLSREDDTLAVRTEDDELHHLPVENVAALYFHGQLEFNTRALDFLSQNGITGHVFNWHEYYTGSYVPKRAKTSGNSLVQQVEHYSRTDDRRDIARALVTAAGKEMLRNVSYYSNRDHDVKSIQETLETDLDRVDTNQSVNELRGIEGTLRETYYRLFAEVLPEEFALHRRSYNPPPNEINSLISFCNSLLYSALLTELYKTHLDPAVSYLHEPGERRFSLCLDLSEVFKPLVVDRLIFRLLNRSQIGVDDFDSSMEGCLLTDSGRKTVVKEFEETLERTVEHPSLNRHVSYQYLLRLEGYKLHKHVLGDAEYEPFTRWW